MLRHHILLMAWYHVAEGEAVQRNPVDKLIVGLAYLDTLSLSETEPPVPYVDGADCETQANRRSAPRTRAAGP